MTTGRADTSGQQPGPWAWVVGLLVALVGVVLILFGSSAPKDAWYKLFLEHLGVAVLVGGLIHLMFELFLVKGFLSEIGSLVAAQIEKGRRGIAEDVLSGNKRLNAFDSVGIFSAHSHLSVREFVQNMVCSDSVSGDGVVRVFESFAFTPGAFATLIRQATRRGRRVELLLGHSDCAFVQSRVAELGLAGPGKESEKIRDELKALMADLRKDNSLREAVTSGQIQLRLFSCMPAAAIWGVGNDLIVSWFLHHKPSINIPHIHCKSSTRLISSQERPNDGKSSLGDEMLTYFITVWEGSVPVPLSYGLAGTPMPEVKPLQVVVKQTGIPDRGRANDNRK